MSARLEYHHLGYELSSLVVMMKTTRHFHICVKWHKMQNREGEIISLKKITKNSKQSHKSQQPART